MKLLLDTHAFLWLVEGSPRMSLVAANAIYNPANDVTLSVASVWELAIKLGNKKLSLADPLEIFVGKWTTAYQIDLLTIQAPHALAIRVLPDHHRDPFDRMLIVQALSEKMTLVTADSKFARYGVPILW